MAKHCKEIHVCMLFSSAKFVSNKKTTETFITILATSYFRKLHSWQ